MQDGPRMRIECDYSRHRANGPRTHNNGAHDQLMTKMQAVKHAECNHRRPLNSCVVSSVKETHFNNCRFPIADYRFGWTSAMPQIGNWQSAIGNESTSNPS